MLLTMYIRERNTSTVFSFLLLFFFPFLMQHGLWWWYEHWRLYFNISKYKNLCGKSLWCLELDWSLMPWCGRIVRLNLNPQTEGILASITKYARTITIISYTLPEVKSLLFISMAVLVLLRVLLLLLVIATISEHTQQYGFLYIDSLKPQNILNDRY